LEHFGTANIEDIGDHYPFVEIEQILDTTNHRRHLQLLPGQVPEKRIHGACPDSEVELIISSV